jgi:zinc protease
MNSNPPREIQSTTLSNGLTIVTERMPHVRSVSIGVWIASGSRLERGAERGIAHFLEHMLFKGTPSHPNIPKVLQERGAQFNGTTSEDRTNYYETLPASDENLEFALRLEADRLVNSSIRACAR